MANRANIERIKRDIYPVTCADIRKFLEDDILGFKLHDLDVRKWNSPNGRASYTVIRISMFDKDVAKQKTSGNYFDKVIAEDGMFQEINEDVEKSLKPFMFPENIDLVKQSTEALAKLWERGIENENLDRIIRFSKINRADKYKKYICFLRPEKIIEYMLQDPATGKIDGSFGIPYTNVFGSTVQDMIWYPVISQEGHSSEPVSLDVLFNQ